MSEWSGVALNLNSHVHYTDHLAVVAILMDIPLLFTEVDHYEEALRCYPGLRAELHDWSKLSSQYLAERYNVYFVSEMWKPAQLQRHGGSRASSLRVVHCPHGFSDKAFWFAQCVDQELTLVYGQNMLDLIQPYVGSRTWPYILSGNLRYDYYLANKSFYDQLVEEEIVGRFARKQPILLYAPTWNDRERSTSFYEAADQICANLPPDYNLLVKIHPNLELDDHITQVYALMGRYQHYANIQFIQYFTPIYPLLSVSDLYIGDRSAVGYDYLAFNRPMFFLNSLYRDVQSDRGVYLFRCGVEVLPKDYGNLFPIMEEALEGDQERFGEVRREMYRYSFVHRPWGEVRKDILKATRPPYRDSCEKFFC